MAALNVFVFIISLILLIQCMECHFFGGGFGGRAVIVGGFGYGYRGGYGGGYGGGFGGGYGYGYGGGYGGAFYRPPPPFIYRPYYY